MIKIIFKCDKCGHDECRISSDYGFVITADCTKCGYEENVNEDEAPTY